MQKIINLEIEGTITGDTRIEEIAIVELPAIQQNFIYFAEEKSFIVPQNISSNACRARKYKEENGSDCGTDIGWVRSSQLCSRKPISLDTVKRMYSYLSRHKVDLESSKSYDDGCGLLMYDAWGGEEAIDWCERILNKEESFDYTPDTLPEYVNYPTGDTENNMLIEEVDFIEKIPYERKDDYISRCVAWHIKNKGWDNDQAYAVCIKQAEEDFSLGEKVSFDYDDVLTTAKGRGLALYELNSGSDVYIISARGNKSGMLSVAEDLGIPTSNVFATGSNRMKVRKIKQLRINKHYDNNEDVISELGKIGQQFNCACLDEFAKVGERGGIAPSKKAPKSDTPNTEPKGEGTAKGDADTTRGAKVSERVEGILKDKSDDFNERYKSKLGYGVNIGMLKSVYQRGVGAYNVSHSPNVNSAEQWALARVNAFLYLVKNGRPENSKYKNDNDLLPKDHPKLSKEKMSKETLDVYGYKTKDFDICPGAIDTFTHLVDMNLDEETQGMVRSAAQIADNVFKIEKDVLELESSTPEQLEQAKILVDDFYDLMNEIDKITDMEHPVEYMDGHIRIIESYLGKEEFNYVEVEGQKCGVHIDENGNEVYIPCSIEKQEEEFEFGVDEYSEDEKKAAILLSQLKDIDYEAFERIVGNLKGVSATEIRRRRHRTPTPYYLYKRILQGEPTRDFCDSIEGRYFTRFQIDLLTNSNKEFGHNRQPYSKWLYKGGPNCVHAWVRVVAIGPNITEVGAVPGTPGIPPKSLPNNGYYSAETKRKSEVAYIISKKKQSMSEMTFADTEKRMVYSPLMIPNLLIPRIDEVTREKYYVKFTPESIEKMQQLYMIEKRLDKTNYEHSNHKFDSMVMVESWIISGESDKAYQLGFKQEDIPIGTWMGGFKILNTEEGDILWNEYIKTGKVKGFSVEGNFILKDAERFSGVDDDLILEEITKLIKNYLTE